MHVWEPRPRGDGVSDLNDQRQSVAFMSIFPMLFPLLSVQ
jgi:hypothetical protein